MKLQIYVHTALQYILYGFSILLYCATITVFYFQYVDSAQLLRILSLEEMTPLLAYSMSGVLFIVFALATLCGAVALYYRTPLHRLEHDAVMEEMGALMHAVFTAVLKGLFDAVPEYRRADEIAKYVQEEVKNVDARVATILGKLGESFLKRTEGMREEDLLKIQHKLEMVSEYQDELQVALKSDDVILSEMEDALDRAEILGEGTEALYAELTARLNSISLRMDNLLEAPESTITQLKPRARDKD